MALDPAELIDLRDALIRARAKGVKTVQMNGERVEYKTDAEMADAVNDLEARIRRASTPRAGSVLFSSSKGV
jgi:hypothetical protein